MSAAFDLPANPVPGQIATLPSGDQVEFNGYAWEPVGPTPLKYPIAIDKGGTGATTVGQARINLFLNNTDGQGIIILDGTAPKPAIAWNTEMGLGWYRASASVIAMAAQGVPTFVFDSAAAGFNALRVTPRAAGSANAMLYSQPLAAANNNVLNIFSDGTQYAMQEVLVGAATPKPLNFGFPGGVQVTSPNAILRLLSSGANNSAHLVMGKPAGSGASVIHGVIDNVTRWQIYLGSGTNDFAISRSNASGVLQESPLTIPINTGDIHISRNLVVGVGNGGAGFSGSAGIVANAAEQSLYMYGAGGGAAYRLFMSVSTGAVYLMSNGALRCNWTLADQFTLNGAAASAWKVGGGPWSDTSDARTKHSIRDYSGGLKEVLALRPRLFKFKPETGREQRDYIGLVYQEAGAIPEMQVKAPTKLGDLEFKDMGGLNTGPLVYALINAVKTLHERIEQLENA